MCACRRIGSTRTSPQVLATCSLCLFTTRSRDCRLSRSEEKTETCLISSAEIRFACMNYHECGTTVSGMRKRKCIN